MINKNEIKKMWVWHSNKAKRKKRYVLYGVDDGCIAVQEQDEETFERGGGYFKPLGWKHYEEIKEPESRAFKAGEMPREYLNYVYRRKTAEICIIPTAYSQVGKVQLCFSALKNVSDEDWISNTELHTNWEVLINDKWQFVGVKE